jgi:CTP synthase (UTP-ammonia lyase)
VEYARNVTGIADAGHAEVDTAGTMVVSALSCSLVGQYRRVRAIPGTIAAAICGTEPMTGYHYCSYGLAPEMLPRLEASGLVISGFTDDGTAEIVELPGHPFYLATLFQPQVTPDDGALHPLLQAFADAAIRHHRLAPVARTPWLGPRSSDPVARTP